MRDGRVVHQHVEAAEHEPGEALARWMQRYVDFIAAKRGLAAALHSGDPAFDALPAYFQKRLRPALQHLLEAAAAAGKVRAGVDPDDLLRGVASLCMPAPDGDPTHARRMVALLMDRLRFGANMPGPKSKKRLNPRPYRSKLNPGRPSSGTNESDSSTRFYRKQ